MHPLLKLQSLLSVFSMGVFLTQMLLSFCKVEHHFISHITVECRPLERNNNWITRGVKISRKCKRRLYVDNMNDRYPKTKAFHRNIRIQTVVKG
jgi:hypothetical protein